MGYRHRNMYKLTGLPGWMRFGYSPGWADRSQTGLPPTAQWLIQSGLLPRYTQWLQTQNVSPAITQPMVPPVAPPTKEQEKQILEQQVQMIEEQLQAIRKRLEELGKQEEVNSRV